MTLIQQGQRWMITQRGHREGGFSGVLDDGCWVLEPARPVSDTAWLARAVPSPKTAAWVKRQQQGQEVPHAMICEEDIKQGWVIPVDVQGEIRMQQEQDGVQPANSNSMVEKPKHYLLFPEYDLQVKDISRRLLDNIERSDMTMSLYQAGWLQQALQYLLRAHAKNGIEDYEKCVESLTIMINSMREDNNQ